MVLNPTFATVGAAYFSNGLRAAWRDEREIRKKLEGDYARTNNWHEEERELLLSLNKAIHRHFEKRDFSSSESEVALYLLKGLSLKEIADLRGSTQGTVKQQAHVLYHKAGIGGRAELSALFLGGLLPEDMTQVDSPRVVQFQPNSTQRILSNGPADEPRESQSLSRDLPSAGT